MTDDKLIKNKGVNKKHSMWWLMLIAGVILIGVGVYAFIEPWNTFIYFIKYTGFVLMLSSVFLLIHALTIKSVGAESNWLMVESIIDMGFSAVLIFNPFLAAIAFPFIIGGWMLFRGIVKIFISLLLSKLIHGWMYILILGGISVVFGAVIIFFPFERVNGISLTMSIFSILIGVVYVYDAFRFKNKEDILIALV